MGGKLKMTPEAQRTAIAQACGWRSFITREKSPHFMSAWPKEVVALGHNPKDTDDKMTTEPIPDYLNDLNAMHEAEKVLWVGDNAKNQIARYNSLLSSWNGGWEFCATAAQRAEAFLRTLGLWKE